jgi:hypothetical protein
VVRPSSGLFRRLLVFLGVPELDFSWADVDQVEAVRGVLPMSFGVEFLLHGKRLIWWCRTLDISRALMDQVSQYVPEKVIHQNKGKVVF